MKLVKEITKDDIKKKLKEYRLCEVNDFSTEIDNMELLSKEDLIYYGALTDHVCEAFDLEKEFVDANFDEVYEAYKEIAEELGVNRIIEFEKEAIKNISELAEKYKLDFDDCDFCQAIGTMITSFKE